MLPYTKNYSLEELTEEATVVFNTVEDFISYYEIKVLDNNGFIINLSVLYEIYCENAENCVEFSEFCVKLKGNNNSNRLAIRIKSNNQSFFRERSLQNVYEKKAKNRSKAFPKFKQRFKLKNKI